MSKTILALLLFSIIAGDGKTVNKIIGGYVGRIEEMPHSVSIRSSGEHNCGGSFIDLDHVLTAAHCLVLPDNLIDNQVQILSGTNNRQDTHDGTLHEVTMIIIHPGYKHGSFIDDIAICKLAKPINATETKRPIALTMQEPPLNANAKISGWGFLSDDSGVNSRYLRVLDMFVTSLSECQLWLTDKIDSRQICTRRNDEKTISNGDSGGGLVYDNKLIGIATASVSGGFVGYPVIYTSVFKYESWIRKVIKKY